MTSKNIANGLVGIYYNIISNSLTVENTEERIARYNMVMPIAKQCSLIAVELLIQQENHYNDVYSIKSTYWQMVREEIKII